MTEPDYTQFYDLEGYLFGEVSQRFQHDKQLSAFDFFCIVIWKANRAKSRISAKLLNRGHASLDTAVRELTRGIAERPVPRDKLRYVMEEWSFRLPMASALLTVLYPEEFTVYDVRVCEAVGPEFKRLAERRGSDDLWQDYEKFRQRVMESEPTGLTLRDKDRYLWGKSFHDQLQSDVKRCFGVVEGAHP